MPNPFAKTRKLEEPYAIYAAIGVERRVLKTYKQPSSEAKDQFARWFIAAKSDATFGSFEYGDTYASEVKALGVLVAATPEWHKAYSIRQDRVLPTPAEYINQKETA